LIRDLNTMGHWMSEGSAEASRAGVSRFVTASFFGCCLVACAPGGGDQHEAAGVEMTALDSLDAAILASPNDPEGYANRSLEFLETGRIADAIADLELALEIDDTDAELWHRLGTVRYSGQDFQGAVRDWQSGLEKTPEHIPSLLSLAEVDIHLRQYERALDRLNEALQADVKLDAAYYMKGRIYKETGDTARAASSLQTAIEVNPQRYDAYIELGLLYAAARNDMALEYYRTARELRPQSVEALYNEAIYMQSHEEEAHWQTALNNYDHILALDPQNASAAFNKGYIHMINLAAYDSAAIWFSNAIEVLPHFHQAHYNLGLALEGMGAHEEALTAYDNALSFKPDYTDAAIAKGRLLH
jgi:tetratricopeptide (TPR) repeat protein